MNDGVKVMQPESIADAVMTPTKDYSLINSKKYAYRIIKRTFDFIVSTIGMIFLLPIALIVKIMYMCTGDFKSVFFVQDRIGKNGKTFRFYKFRTMCQNADEVLFKLLEEDPKAKEEYSINKKLKNDPRITKVGKILRKSSLDELPQLLKPDWKVLLSSA